jgi:hypothetical protein
MGLISARTHGIVDYAAIVWLAITPRLVGFGVASTAVSLTASMVILLIAITTLYPLGLLRVVPLAGHLVMDYLLGALLVASPWLFGFSPLDPGGPFVVGAGVSILATALMTAAQASRRHRRTLMPA